MVDKLYIMLPEFRVNEYDYGRAKRDFAKEQKTIEEFASFFKDTSIMSDLEGTPIKFKEWFNEHKEEYKYDKPKLSKIKYDLNKEPQENSLQARNNLFIDMIWGVLTNSDTAGKILNPGGFDYQKKAARIISILQSIKESDLIKELNIDKGSIINKLESMSLKELNKLAERTKRKLDPISPRTQVLLHQQNMTGAKMIGIYANHNANHALIQHTNLAISENSAFTLNGKTLTSLHNMMNDNKEFISRNNAGFLAASVDNVKDPVLAALNQNEFTADATMLLSRLGYNPIEIGLLMSQPIVKEMTETYFKEKKNGTSKDVVINDIIRKFKKRASMMEQDSYDNYKNNKFLISELADNIIIAKEMDNIEDASQTSDRRKVDFYKEQAAVGYLFSRIMKDSDALSRMVQATRADTPNGAAGPTIADTEIKIQKLNDLLEEYSTDKNFPLEGLDFITSNIDYTNENDLREKLLSNKLPFLQAFYTLGLEQTEEMLKKYFPQLSLPFRNVIENLRGMTKTGRLDVKTMNSIYNDLFAYILTKTNFFGAEDNVTSEDKRSKFINSFVDYFKKTVAENPDIAELEFVKRLKVSLPNDVCPVAIVGFKNVGHLSATLKERYTRDWASLLYMNNPKAQEFALNLFRYNFFRNGLAFGPSTFSHLTPTIVKMAIPEYVSTLRELLTNEDEYSEFVDQYVYNHLDNRKLVPEIPNDTSISFMDEQKNLRNEIIFSIDSNSNPSDMRIVKNKISTPDGDSYSFFRFISKRLEGGNAYYKLQEVQDNGNVIYKKINPLGVRNNFIEYQYGKLVDEMTSVVKTKDSNYKSRTNEDNFLNSYETPQMSEDDSVSYDKYLNGSEQSILDDAYMSMYGEHFEEPISENDVTSLNPNTEFKDANDETICGAPIIKSY